MIGKSRVQRATSRAGLSLLEVLFSIGVALIGLLGVAALLPLAVYYMGRGSVADNAAIFGRSAVSAFKSRQMHRNTMWAVWNPGANAFVMFFASPAVIIDPLLFPSPLVGGGPSFCIDPLYLSRSVRDGNPPPSLFPAVPVSSTVEPRMARVTLRSAPGAPPLLSPNTPNPLFTMPSIVAEELFMLTDQHVYLLPRDRTLPPVPGFSVDPNTNQPEKRQYDPNLSWFATLTPIVSPAGGFFDDSDLYLLSIVVVESRDLRTDINENLTDRPIERVVDVHFHGNASTGDWAGGSVVLVNRPGRPESDLEVRPGDWLMLGGRLNNTGSPGPAVFRWYRVLSADRDSTELTGPVAANLFPTPSLANPRMYREVVLHGTDWNPNAVLQTQATILSGVTAVLEKIVRIETSSLWTR
jgi:hypothetical protein